MQTSSKSYEVSDQANIKKNHIDKMEQTLTTLVDALKVKIPRF